MHLRRYDPEVSNGPSNSASDGSVPSSQANSTTWRGAIPGTFMVWINSPLLPGNGTGVITGLRARRARIQASSEAIAFL